MGESVVLVGGDERGEVDAVVMNRCTDAGDERDKSIHNSDLKKSETEIKSIMFLLTPFLN